MYSNLVSDRIFAVPAGLRVFGVQWRTLFTLTMASGARMVEAREGYPPVKLAIGGLIVWALFLGMMAIGNETLPVLK